VITHSAITAGAATGNDSRLCIYSLVATVLGVRRRLLQYSCSCRPNIFEPYPNNSATTDQWALPDGDRNFFVISASFSNDALFPQSGVFSPHTLVTASGLPVPNTNNVTHPVTLIPIHVTSQLALSGVPE
jgi:hypothetical protein